MCAFADQDRRYTVRQATRIQSFPDDFVFAARSVQGKYKLVGNAVPPVLAWTIARALWAHLAGEASVGANLKNPP